MLVNGEPTQVAFNEQYPHMVTAWVYDHQYLSEDFNYEDLEKEYLENEAKTGSTAGSLKAQLDQAHNM